MTIFVFGESKVAFGVVTDENDKQYLLIQQTNVANTLKPLTAKDAFLQFPSRADFQSWINSLQRMAPDFKE